MKIISVKVEREHDTDPDFSDLGQFVSARDIGYKDWYVKRSTGEMFCGLEDQGGERIGKHKGGGVFVSSHAHPFFKPSVENYVGCNKKTQLKYCFQDWERAEGLGQVWHYLRIVATAQIEVGGVIQIITSGGLCGVPTDSEDVESHESEELAGLRSILAELGFKDDDLYIAFAMMDRKAEPCTTK